MDIKSPEEPNRSIPAQVPDVNPSDLVQPPNTDKKKDMQFSILGQTKGRKTLNIILLVLIVLFLIWFKGGFDVLSKKYELIGTTVWTALIVDDSMSDAEIEEQARLALKFDKTIISESPLSSSLYVLGKSREGSLMELANNKAYNLQIISFLEKNMLGFASKINGEFTRKSYQSSDYPIEAAPGLSY